LEGLMNKGIQILQLMEELYKMPEYQLYAQLQESNVTIYTFNKNFLELHNLLNFLSNDPLAEEIHFLENMDIKIDATLEIVRFLHNFLASAKSLVDHTRVLYNKLYATSGKFIEYQDRVKLDFANDPLSSFVQDLRNYYLHIKTPNINISYSNWGNTLTITFNLLKDDLLTWDGWKPPSKKFLTTIDTKVEILKIASDYKNKVFDFQRWFHTRQEEIHSEEFQCIRTKERELLFLKLENNIDSCYSKSQQSTPFKKSEIFLSIVTSKEYRELKVLSEGSFEQGIRAIELLEQEFFAVPEELKQKILKLYKEPNLPINKEQI
jgi:ribosomal 50S subunit-recycling heat shock protein